MWSLHCVECAVCGVGSVKSEEGGVENAKYAVWIGELWSVECGI